MRINYYYKVMKAALRIGVITFTEYPLDSLIWCISMIAREGAGFIGVLLLARMLGGLGGWGIYEICLLFGMAMLTEAIGQLFLDAIWSIGSRIRKGKLDTYFFRPLPIFFQLITSRIMFQASVSVGAAVCLIVFSIIKIGIAITIENVLFFMEYIICGCIINSSIYCIFNSLNFWFVHANDIADLVQTIREFAKYPIHVFPTVVKYILTYVVPFGFVGYYPAQYIVGEGNKWLPLILVVVTIIVMFIAKFIWETGLKRYDSTGS